MEAASSVSCPGYFVWGMSVAWAVAWGLGSFRAVLGSATDGMP